jgi:hypothetical protein
LIDPCRALPVFQKCAAISSAQSLHLVFGFENGQFGDHRRVSAYHVPPAYDPPRSYEILAHDWALLKIAIPEKVTTRPLNVAHSPSATMNLTTAGYAKRTPWRSEDSGLLFDSRQASEGFSGGPMLLKSSDRNSFAMAGSILAIRLGRAISIASDALCRAIRPVSKIMNVDFST